MHSSPPEKSGGRYLFGEMVGFGQLALGIEQFQCGGGAVAKNMAVEPTCDQLLHLQKMVLNALAAEKICPIISFNKV